MRNEQLLEKLTQLIGVAGYEKPVRDMIRAEVTPYADEIIEDAMGNLIVPSTEAARPMGRRSCSPPIWTRSASW